VKIALLIFEILRF